MFLDGCTTKTFFDLVNVTNADGSTSVSGTGYSYAATVNEVTHSAAGSLSAFAGPGVLKLRVDTEAFVNALPFYEPRVYSSVGARMDDALLVTSSTLSPGTLTDYNVTLSIEVAHSNPIYYKPEGFPHGTLDFGLSFGAGGGTGFHVPIDFGGPSASWPVDNPMSIFQVYTGQAAVGDSIPISMGISAAAQEWVRQGDGIVYRTFIDGSHTVTLFVDAVTPGVSLVSESGHDYSTNAVPEPSTFALGSLALAALAARSTRR